MIYFIQFNKTTIQQTIYRQRTESSHKPTNNTAPGEDIIHPQMIKKTTTRDTEVPARYV